ncbi:MAG: histidine kinase [Gemmatimonadetes bacterium]|nr:histidine kinase [Gemmatimonadota bacterium]
MTPPEERLRWLLVLGVWAVPALLAALETYTFARIGGRPLPLWRAVATQAPAWLVYAAATPIVFALARRLPLRRGSLARALPLHLLASLGVAAVYAAVAAGSMRAFGPAAPPYSAAGLFWRWYLSSLPLTTLTYAGLLGVVHAYLHHAEARRRSEEAALLGAQLAEARLGALRMQLHPHFLFNTLNAMTVLARDGESRQVARMLTLLAELLREVLENDPGQFVTLEREVAFVRRYLEIEKVRFGDRLRVAERMPAEAMGALVPAFVLQPLVENALRHGLGPRAAGGTIELGARMEDGMVELVVRDDGAGLPGGRMEPGIGLGNTAARLRELYRGAAALEVVPAPGGGTEARVRLPRKAP